MIIQTARTGQRYSPLAATGFSSRPRRRAISRSSDQASPRRANTITPSTSTIIASKWCTLPKLCGRPNRYSPNTNASTDAGRVANPSAHASSDSFHTASRANSGPSPSTGMRPNLNRVIGNQNALDAAPRAHVVEQVEEQQQPVEQRPTEAEVRRAFGLEPVAIPARPQCGQRDRLQSVSVLGRNSASASKTRRVGVARFFASGWRSCEVW